MTTVIKVENLGKQYRLGEVGTGSLSHDLNRWWANMRGKEDPFAKVGKDSAQTRKVEGDYVWALKDISFEITAGEVLGILGRNGAGKSTLLKILSKVTKPSKGRILTRGRIASLLEVGTGFHPEMTGRDNVFLNGAIMGMTRNEIRKRFDEIVDFSGVEHYIDTPVKRYSSGMYVRLAFAVAAYLESEILIVDEVLAVGDVDFQKKCMGKMEDVSRGEGKTVLFVSHNTSAISQLCTRGIVINDGILKFSGLANKAIEVYLSSNKQMNVYTSNGYIDLTDAERTTGTRRIFNAIRILNESGKVSETFRASDAIKIEILLTPHVSYQGMDYGVSIFTSSMQRVTSFATWMNPKKVQMPNKINVYIPKILLSSGTYILSLSCTHPKEGIYIDKIDIAASFTVEALDLFQTGRDFTSEYGILIPQGSFILE